MKFILSFTLIFCGSLSIAQTPSDSSLYIHYRIQVGSFRSPSDLRFDNFKDVQREIFGDVRRYTVGFFNDIESANLYADTVKSMGYSDAFVVGYINGDRATLKEISEARRIIESRPRLDMILEVDSVPITEQDFKNELNDTLEVTDRSSSAEDKSVKRNEIEMLRQKLNRITWMKVAIGQTMICGAAVLGIVTGAWVPIMMGAAVVEFYLVIESKYRFNRRDLKKLEQGIK